MHLTKEYERDISVVLEEWWTRGFVDLIPKRYGLTNPDQPYVVFYSTGENLQIWEHKAAFDRFKDWLLGKNQESPAFLESVIAAYRPVAEKAAAHFARGAETELDAVKEYAELAREGIMLFSIWYYSGYDERTPEEVRKLAIALRATDEFFARNDKHIKDSLIARGVPAEYAGLVFHEEFISPPPREVLATRAGGMVSIDGDVRFNMTLTDFAAAHPGYSFEGLHAAGAPVTELKGQVAQKGKVRGAVRIVKNKRQMENVAEGDILVSPMTTPDFLPAMKKAAAFVTDEGGIMCHAAIVAREMKKPCVIGTKIATQVLKDGDLVEVDAEKGIVRKL